MRTQLYSLSFLAVVDVVALVPEFADAVLRGIAFVVAVRDIDVLVESDAL